MELIVFLIIAFAGVWLLGIALDAKDKAAREKSRQNRAFAVERTRNRNNERLELTDCYVYLIKRAIPSGYGFQTYLKIGIGVEERVKEQLRVPNTELIILYIYRNRWDAVHVEQKVISRWNSAFSKTSTLDYTSPGTEFILWDLKSEAIALEIIKNSIGTPSKHTLAQVSQENSLGDYSQSPKSNDQLNTLKVTSFEDVPELQRTQVYLLENKSESLLKIGMGKFSRPDTFRRKGWKVIRFSHFPDRKSARNAEKAVLNFWRNDLKMQSPDRAKRVMQNGFTETVDSKAGIEATWNIVKRSKDFMPALTAEELKIYDDYLAIFRKACDLWPENEFYNSVYMTYKAWDKMSNLRSALLSASYDKKLSKERKKEIKRVIGKLADDALAYHSTYTATLRRVELMKDWL